MKINAAQQLKATIGTTRNYKVDDIAGNGNPVRGEAKLTRTNQGILVKAMLHTRIETACSRCMSSFAFPITLNIVEEYFPIIDVVSGASLPMPDDPGCFTIDENHILDLTEALSQYALLAVPMKPLCREDCAGLCPGCGKDLNQAACSCPPQEIDPRWSVLKESLSVSPPLSLSPVKGNEEERQ